jgi:hopanoid-associated phosphorylase
LNTSTGRSPGDPAHGSPSLIVVVGMTREARIVGHPGVMVIVGGGQTDRLTQQLDLALQQGATGVMSFGLCGGLEPSLQAGDLLIGAGVADGEGWLAADDGWAERLACALPGALRAEVVGVDAMVALPADKAALRCRTGAAAADMESHIVARLANRLSTPFAVLRAVCDPAGRALPTAAQVGLAANGDADIGAVLKALVRRPGELPALVRTAREADAAFRALRDARHLLGPGLGCPNFVEHPVDVT